MQADAARYFAERGTPPVIHLLRRRPSTVEAMQVRVGYEVPVADWCGGVPVYGRGVVVWTCSGDLAHADYGDWVVRGPNSTFEVVDDHSIFAEFEALIPVVAE